MKTGMKLMLIMIITVLPAAALAQDALLKVTPGKYQIKRKTAPGNDPNVAEKIEEKCIYDPVFKPESVLPPQGNCKASNVKKDGNTVTFDIDCAGGAKMPPLTAKAEYSSNGMAISWHIVFTFTDENSGRPLTIIDSAEGKRIGDCSK